MLLISLQFHTNYYLFISDNMLETAQNMGPAPEHLK